ncbi:OmpH family outer membrane protein [Litorimonas sp.]|uniref:OmpH family outer membrane protein n=1 Tax=Litorimonas sp. TaxID=1892381 RepID=UPI003A84D4CF
MFKKFSRASALGLFALVSMSSSAFAQTILVVDSQKVISESKVGKYVASQINSIESTAATEVKGKQAVVQNKAKSLNSQFEGKNQEELLKDPTFKTQYQQLQQDQQKFKAEYAKINEEMQITRQKAIIPVMKKFSEIVNSVGAERNADAVVDINTALYVSPTADITQTVLTKLDQQMTTTPVVRERLPNKQ